MTLGSSRIVLAGETPHAHEREAIDFVIDALPNTDPFQVWALLELLEPSSGRLYEIDLIVLGYSALYLVEVKSGPGRYEGDAQDWYRKGPEDSATRYMENPYRLTNAKAKVLASRLRTKMKNPRDMPWIEPLVFLSAKDIELKFRNHGDLGVVTRDTFKAAVQFHEIPGVDKSRTRQPIATPVMRDVAKAFEAMGLRPRKGKSFAGTYELGDLLGEGPGYQDRLATHRDQKTFTRRARTYAVPQQTSVERRQQLRRAADRESQLLWDVREHPNVLRFADYVTDAELGPTVLFDAFDGIPLDAFLRNDKQLSFFERIDIVEQVGRALAYCHRKGVVHGALSPEAVLVRRAPDSRKLETRLFNFQLGVSVEVEATMHWSALASEPWAIYQAPELRENPTQRSPTSDVFSLGALTYFVLTGKAPGQSAVEVDQRLVQDRCLDPRAVDDGLSENIAKLVEEATQLSPVNRANDVETWVELLLAEVTRPVAKTSPTNELNPLDARPGDTLGEDLVVEKTPDGRPLLGQGATARVLLVSRVSDGKQYALKVSLGPEHDERFAQEASVLEGIRHARIVHLVDTPTFAGRPCLLMSLAGTETLHRHLAQEGTVSLDRAARYGEDLLSALEHLEEHQVVHRDIKPANLGVGSVGKGANHLTLFDFSLTTASKTDLHVGTAAYRDPFLRLRGTWDYAAERWSAAVTLHEMLTGTRPSFSSGPADGPRTPGSALDADAELIIAVERFDPSVRDQLAAFFLKAFARDIENRFATCDEMRRTWNVAFGPSRASLPSKGVVAAATSTASDGDVDDVLPVSSHEELVAIAPDTAIDALPLSPRARNALDRAGFLVARDLLGLADNRLSAIRGIGRRVAEEILSFRLRWRDAQTETVVESTPFFPNYRGEDLLLDGCSLPATVVLALEEAGLTTLSVLAAAPAGQVKALAKRHGVNERQVRDLLSTENAGANERTRPSTIEGWVDALLSKKKKSARHARELYGLEEPFRGRLGLSVRDVADTLQVTTPAVYIALGKSRDEWAKHGAIADLRGQVVALVAQAGGAMPMEQAARGLMANIPSDRAADADSVLVQAMALVRIAAEVDKDADVGLRTLRVHDTRLWLCESDAHARGVKALGDVADSLAARPSVPGPGEVARALADAVTNTPLALLSPERLADVGAAASRGAARSARMEIYPRQMPAERALELSSSQLKSGLTPAEIKRRVRLRYPDANVLPDRPELDTLLKPHGLVFDDVSGAYARPGEAEHTVMATRVSSVLRAQTALPTQAMAMDAAAISGRQFDEQLRNAVERRAFRVVGVRADRAREAAVRIADRIGTEPTVIDTLLVAAIREQMRKGGIKREDLIHDADRGGRLGPAWPNLQRLVEAAAAEVAASLLPAHKPLLLVQPGLIARYRLEGFLQKLMAPTEGKAPAKPDGKAPGKPDSTGPAAVQATESAAIFLLVPSHDMTGIPRINGELAIPGVLQSQVLWVSLDWLANKHNAAA